MKKIATFVALAWSATSVSGNCVQNWITDDLGVDSTGNSGATLTANNDWATCKTIKDSGTSCCAKEVVDGFQDRANAIVDALKTTVGKRDKFLLDRRGDVLNVRDSLNSIQASVNKLAGQSGEFGNLGDVFAGFLDVYESQIKAFTTEFDKLKAAFLTYQKDRMKCFNTLIQAQVALWCAACSADPSTIGFNTNPDSVNYGDAFTTEVVEACTDYITGAVGQSQILSLYYFSGYVSTLASALEKMANGDTAAAIAELQEFFTDMEGRTEPSQTLEKTVYSIGTCTTTGCSWITETLFNKGILDKDLAVVGGSLTEPLNNRLLQEIPTGRMLQFNQKPSEEAEGIEVDFPENPGEVDNDQNSAIRNGAVACAITALAALL